MRHPRLSVLATVSFVALISAGVSAQSPKVTHLGVLKPQDSWRVGTVNAQGAAYCAMVNKFDKDTVLAVARDPDGYGSLALNFADALFTPNMEYETKLSVGGKNWTYNARASNDRALIVQSGQDEAFFKALNGNGAMAINMAVADATFAMENFSATSADLVECAASLKPAPAVADAKQELDSAIDSVSGNKAPVEMAANEQGNSLDAMEAELDNKVKPADVTKPETVTAKIEDKPKAADAPLKEEIKKPEVKIAVAPEPEPAPVPKPEPVAETAPTGRKLLAGMGTASGGGSALASVDTIVPLSSGTVAQLLEQRQVEALQQRAAAEPVKKAEEKIAAKPPEKKEEKKAEKKPEPKAEKQIAAKETPAFKETVPALATTQAPDPVPMGEEIVPDMPAGIEEITQSAVESAMPSDTPLLDTGSSLLASPPSLLDVPQDRSLLASNTAPALTEVAEIAEVPAVPPMMEQQAPVPSASQSRAERRAAESERQQAETRARAKLEAEKTRLAALENLRAAQVMSAEELARQEEVFAQQKKLNELSSEVTSLASERDSLKKQLEQAAALNAQITPQAAKLAEMEAALKRSEQARIDSEMKLKEAYSQKTQNSNEIARIQADMQAKAAEVERLKAERAVQQPAPVPVSAPVDNIAVAKLKAELAEKDARVEAMRRELDSRQADVSTKARESEEGLARTNALIAQAQARVDNIARAEEQMQATAAPMAVEQLPPPVVAEAPPKIAAAKIPALPVVPTNKAAAPVQQAAVENPNRASAFLDRIMSFHRGDAPAPKPVAAEAKPWSASGLRPGQAKTGTSSGQAVSQQIISEVKNRHVSSSVTAQPPAPVPAPAPAAPSVSAVQPDNRFEDVLSAAAEEQPVVASAPVPAPAHIDTHAQAQAGTISSPPVMPSTAPQARIEQPVAYATEKTVAAATAQATPSPVTLETLLDKSGMRGISLVPVVAEPGAVVRQWSSGRIDGMYEQTGASGNFDAEVQNYLDRYRQDCPGNLDVKLGDARTTSAGRMAEGAILCSNPSNGYSTSFVFLQASEGFSAILHTGYPKDSAMIKSISDNIAHTLSGADRFVPPQSAGQTAAATQFPLPVMSPVAIPVTAPISAPPVMPAYNMAPRVQMVAPPPAAPLIAPSAAQPLKFKIRDIAPAAGSNRPGEEFGTTVIE
jgi:hypothetical protein